MKASDLADVRQRPVEVQYLAVPAAPGNHLSNGLVIEGSIVARLLGLRLLRLDTHIALVPTDFVIQPPGSSGALWSPPGGLDDAVDLLGQASRTLGEARVR